MVDNSEEPGPDEFLSRKDGYPNNANISNALLRTVYFEKSELVASLISCSVVDERNILSYGVIGFKIGTVSICHLIFPKIIGKQS